MPFGPALGFPTLRKSIFPQSLHCLQQPVVELVAANHLRYHDENTSFLWWSFKQEGKSVLSIGFRNNADSNQDISHANSLVTKITDKQVSTDYFVLSTYCS